MSDSLGNRNPMSERRRGTTGWFCNDGFLLAMVLIALLSTLSGCGSGQTDVGQASGNSVPVNLSISMPQESAAASTRESRFWATVQSWLPSLSNAWAATTRDLRTLTVQVTGPDILSPITKTEGLSDPQSGNVIPITLDVPAGSERVFTVFGLDGTGLKIFQGESTSTTLTVGTVATVNINLRNTSVTITTASLPSGTTTQNYRATVAASGGTPPYTWSIVGGSLPAGLSLSPSGATAGQITGTPTTASTFTQTYRVQDSTGAADTKSLTITVNAQLTIDTTTLPNGTVDQKYSSTLTASGGTPSYTWSVLSGSTAPGLSLSSNGAITGTPTTPGTFQSTYRVQDSNGAAVTKSLILNVNAALTITTIELPDGFTCEAYIDSSHPTDTIRPVALSASGGTGTYIWSIDDRDSKGSPLPPAPGLSLSPSGAITGTPTTTGTFTRTYRVKDSNGAAVTKDLTISVFSCSG